MNWKNCFFMLLASLFITGCSHGTNFWENRYDDVRDIFTFTAGGGFGGKVQAGPFIISMYNYSPKFGLHGGEFFTSTEPHNEFYHMSEGNVGIMWLCCDREICYPSERAARRGKVYGAVTPLLPVLVIDREGISKEKYCNNCYWSTRKFLNRQYREYCQKTPAETRMNNWSYRRKHFSITRDHPECGGRNLLQFYKPNYLVYSDINICAALVGGFRCGFNPGELVDFLLGWCGVDIAGDDL